MSSLVASSFSNLFRLLQVPSKHAIKCVNVYLSKGRYITVSYLSHIHGQKSCSTASFFDVNHEENRKIKGTDSSVNYKQIRQINGEIKTEKKEPTDDFLLDMKNSAKETVSNSHRQKPVHKIHKRVFTQEDKLKDSKIKENIQNLAEEDAFGKLNKTTTRKHNFKVDEQTDSLDYEIVSGKSETDTDSKINDLQQKTIKDSPKQILRTDRNDTEKYYGRKNYRPRDNLIQTSQKNKASKFNDQWADQFGTLKEKDLEERIDESLNSDVGSPEGRYSSIIEKDEEDEESTHIRLSSYNRCHIPLWYGRKITKLSKHGKVREAIELLEEDMLKKDRVMPNAYVFTSLISALGHAGYTQKAFQLFNKMKKMGIKPKPQTYTALFNACANSPWPQDGLARAKDLCQLLQEKCVKTTFITGKAMIKAFALCGDLKHAFITMDKLAQADKLDAEAFSFLLMACVSDKHSGLRHAIQVWRHMLKMKVQPDLPLYNLLIRCLRDCGTGDATSLETLLGETSLPVNNYISHPKPSEDFITLNAQLEGSSVALKSSRQKITESYSRKNEAKDKQKSVKIKQYNTDDETGSELLSSTEENKHWNISSSLDKAVMPILPEKDLVPSVIDIPDILSPTCNTSRVYCLGDLSSKENRLALLGGVEGILHRMSEDNVTPDIRTFTQLVSIALPTIEAEVQLLEMMKKMKVKPDIDFFNNLMHKRCLRSDFSAAKEVKQLISDYGLTSNIQTYGVMAMTCKSEKEGHQLIQEMEAAELQPNIQILGTLMYAAGSNFAYKLWVLRTTQNLDLSPNQKFLQHIESNLTNVRAKIVQAEKERKHTSFLKPYFLKSFEQFVLHYETWLKQVSMEMPPHPWATFKTKKE